jgi:ankyrin repeat protein
MPPHLSEALKYKNFNVVHKLLNVKVKPIPVDIRSKELKTGLMLSCSYKDPKTVGEFLNKGAKLELTDMDDGWTALHYASHSGCQESAKHLIDKGANIEAKTNINETPLHLAAQKNNLDVVKLLIKKGAHIEAKTNKNKTAVYLAATLNHVSIVECLAAKNCQMKEALKIAVENNFVEIAKCLLSHLTRTKELNEEELNDLLVKAAYNGHTNVANELLVNGANVKYSEGIFIKEFLFKCVFVNFQSLYFF